MAKNIINTGTGPNANDSDSLRTAFTKINANFTELYTATDALVAISNVRIIAGAAPATSKGAAGDTAGMLAVGNGYLYVCLSNWTTGSNDIWSRTAITASTW